MARLHGFLILSEACICANWFLAGGRAGNSATLPVEAVMASVTQAVHLAAAAVVPVNSGMPPVGVETALKTQGMCPAEAAMAKAIPKCIGEGG